MSDGKPPRELATEITIATIQKLSLERYNLENDQDRQHVSLGIQDIYKAAMKAIKENQ